MTAKRFHTVLQLDFDSTDSDHPIDLSDLSDEDAGVTVVKRKRHASKKASQQPPSKKGKGTGKSSDKSPQSPQSPQKTPVKDKTPVKGPGEAPGEAPGDAPSDDDEVPAGTRKSSRKRIATKGAVAEKPKPKTSVYLKLPAANLAQGLAAYVDEEALDFGLANEQEVYQAKTVAYKNGLKLMRVSFPRFLVMRARVADVNLLVADCTFVVADVAM